MSEAVPTRDDIATAADRIHWHVRRTPTIATFLPNGGSVVLKLEHLQHTGSFKPRGAFNKLLTADVPDVGVIAASGGNFGMAVAYAAHALGHPAEIFVPQTSPAAKIDRIREMGAEVRVISGYYAEAQVAASERASSTGALAMHPYDQPEVVAGQGTIGLEIAGDVPDADVVLVAIGGGGLIGGIAAWFRHEVRVIGVEPVACATMTAALAAGAPVRQEVGGLAADSLGAAVVGDIALAVVRDLVERVVLVDDDAIRDAQRWLWRELRIVAEPGGAAATAALLSGAYVPLDGRRVVSIVCGANCDPASVV